MKELPPAASAVLHEARRAHEPSDRDVERSLALLHANLSFAPDPVEDLGQLGGSRQHAGPASAVTTKASIGLLTAKLAKLSLVVAALSGALAGSWWTRTRSVEQPASRVRFEPAAGATEAAVSGVGQAAAATDAASRTTGSTKSTHASVEPSGPQAHTHAGPDIAPRFEASSPLVAVRTLPVAPRDRRSGRGAAPSASAKASRVAPASADAAGVSVAPASADSAGASESNPAAHPPAHQAKPATSATSTTTAAADSIAPPAAALSQARAASELALIDRASLRLRDGDASGALGLLDEHLALYPAGMLRTERMGLRVLALCAAGRREQARLEGAAFLREAGRSPLAVRVRRACQPDPTR